MKRLSLVLASTALLFGCKPSETTSEDNSVKTDSQGKLIYVDTHNNYEFAYNYRADYAPINKSKFQWH